MADCCESIVVPGATFTMGGTKDPMDGFVWPVIGLVPYVATVSTYSLDRFEVTVGRFRAFVAAYDAVVTGGGIPDGAGRNPNVAVPFLPRGSGWAEEWNAVLPLTSSDLVKQVTLLSSCPYTKAPGSNERKPMGCMTWYQAFAFCAWDGGRLPTEAEWEMAATNGSANTNFPWGDSPVPDASHALFGPGAGTGNVGSKPAGANALGHRDLGGNVAEWVVDRYFDYPTSPSTNYAKSGQDHDRVFRGGSASDLAYALRAASRNYDVPSLIADSVGLRCARTP